jgi:hypothetical protein
VKLMQPDADSALLQTTRDGLEPCRGGLFIATGIHKLFCCFSAARHLQ